MKKYIILLALVFGFVALFAQTESDSKKLSIEQMAVGLKLTNAPISLSYKILTNTKFGTELNAGIASLNSDTQYDDFMVDLRIFYSIRKKEKSNLFAGLVGGIEFVDDPTFNLTTPYFGLTAGYEYYLGKKRRNGLAIEVGYIYGQKTYRKSYKATWGSVEYIGAFENNPLMVGLAYSYYF